MTNSFHNRSDGQTRDTSRQIELWLSGVQRNQDTSRNWQASAKSFETSGERMNQHPDRSDGVQDPADDSPVTVQRSLPPHQIQPEHKGHSYARLRAGQDIIQPSSSRIEDDSQSHAIDGQNGPDGLQGSGGLSKNFLQNDYRSQHPMLTEAGDDIPTNSLDHRSSADIASSRISDEESGILYYCTFCPKTFSSSSSWRRHEIEQHVQPPTWVCQPALRNAEGVLVCFFCDQEIERAPCSHNLTRCSARQGGSKTFKRKYLLKKHLTEDHNLSPQLSERVLSCFKVDTVIDIGGIDLTCYFCGYLATTWRDRADHVGNHFRLQPCTKSEWDAKRRLALGPHG